MSQRRILGAALTWVCLAGSVAWAQTASEETRAKPSAAEAAYRQHLKAVRLIEIRHLRSGKPKEFKEGRQKLLAIEDKAAVAPIVHVLYGPNQRYRGLLIETLQSHVGRGSEAAKAYLQEMAVGDGSRAHRSRAVKALLATTLSGERPPTERLMAHLALDEVPVLRDRAATALATLKEKRAVWLLVERLVTEEIRLVGAEVSDYSMQLDIRAQNAGVPQFRQRTISAAVPGLGIATVTIDLPEVAIVDVATTIAMTDRHVGPKYERVKVRHAAVLAALKRLTGKNFGYNQAAWQKWLRSDPEEIPPWEPVRFKADGPKVRAEE